MTNDMPQVEQQVAKPSEVTGVADGNCSTARPSLAEIGARVGVDKITYHQYHFFYAETLERFRDHEGALLEIGIHEGRSLQMWLAFFSRAFIYGIDINVSARGPRHHIFKSDQNDIPRLRALAQSEIRHPVFLVIDDGSHIPEHQARSFDFLFRELLVPGGIYVIEDVEVSYWTRGGLYGYRTRYGYRHPASIIEIFKSVVDEVNGEFLTDANRYAQDLGTSNCLSRETREMVSSVSFGKNCIIISKKTEAELRLPRRDYRFAQQL
jgi:hypothetical protein